MVDEADSKSVGLITRAGSTPATGTSVRRSKHRSVSALRRKLHYVSSFFLLNCDPLCWARSLVFMFRCISIQNLSQNTESDQQMVLFFLSKSNPFHWASIWFPSRSQHRSVSASRRKLHYVGSFFLFRIEPAPLGFDLLFLQQGGQAQFVPARLRIFFRFPVFTF